MIEKSKSTNEDWRLQPLQRSAPPAMLHPSETISSIGSDMTVIGQIVCKGILKIYGLVEGEVIASNALIADGARIQGDILAEELTVGGRVNGSIHALRVKLKTTAVVEGDIFHRSLSIDEHAWFEGCSRPENNPPEPRSSIRLESSTPQPRQQALVALDDQGAFADFTKEVPAQLRQSGISAFLAAWLATMAIGVMGHFAFSALQQPTGLAYTTHNVRIDPGWTERSTQLGWMPLVVRASISKTSQTATVATAPETAAPKTDADFVDQEQVAQTPQSLASLPQAATVAIAPGTAVLDQEQVAQTPQSLASLPQTVEQFPAGQAQIAPDEAKSQPADVEILGKIPVPRPRPPANFERRSMPALPRSARP